MTVRDENTEFWRLVSLAEHDPAAYNLEMDIRRFNQIARASAGILDLEWCERALIQYFGISPDEVRSIMRHVMKGTVWEGIYTADVTTDKNPSQ
jgi:hypothetical protein